MNSVDDGPPHTELSNDLVQRRLADEELLALLQVPVVVPQVAGLDELVHGQEDALEVRVWSQELGRGQLARRQELAGYQVGEDEPLEQDVSEMQVFYGCMKLGV